MEGTTSISKGIFVLKKSRSSSRPHSGKKKKIQNPDIPWIKEPWYSAYKKTWQHVEQQVKDLFQDIFSKLLTDVSMYLKHEKFLNNAMLVEIPTAVILTGINLPDHSVLFSSLVRRLEEDVSPHVVLLSSRSCAKVRTMVGHILHQCQHGIQAEHSLISEDNDSEEEEEEEYQEKCQRVVPCTFSELVDWYLSQQYDDKTPIVVIISDFEGFQSQVLEDFIHIASEYREQLPLCLVLGVATTLSAVHAALPHRVMSHLRMQIFTTQNSNTLLNHLIDKVILSPQCPFRIGGSVFNMLSDIFIFFDFSIQNFLQRFKYCMLAHYRKHGVAISRWNKAEVEAWISQLGPKELDDVRKLPSFRTYIQAQSAQDKKALLSNSQFFKETTIKLIQNFLKHFTLFLIGLKCLSELAGNLPGAPLGKYLGNFYSKCVSSPVEMSAEFRKCEELWQNLSNTGLELHLRNIIRILQEAKTEHKEIESQELDHWISALQSEMKRLHNLGSKSEKCPSPHKSSRYQDLKNLTSRAQLSEQLKELAHAAPEQNQFECLRSDILRTLQTMLGGGPTSLLQPPTRRPLHELVLFEETVNVVREELIGSSRLMLHNALADPQTYLKCECCKLNDIGDIRPCLPDICIAYKLHLECGKHINLYDWMQSFNQVVNPDPGDDKIDMATQSRFTQAVSELQFLGFVKPTTRKADHVIRLTYGHS